MARMRITSDSDAAAPWHGWRAGPQLSGAGPDPARRERSHLALALLVSLLIHALLLSLTFGGDELGLPGLAFPWRDRRFEVPDLRVVLVPERFTAAAPAATSAEVPPQRTSIDPPLAGAPVPTLSALPAPEPQARVATNEPATAPTAQVDAMRSEVAEAVAPAAPDTRAKEPDRPVPAQIAQPAAIDVEPADGPSSVLRADRSPDSVVAVAPSASSPQPVPSSFRDPGDAAQEAQREEAARQEAAATVEVARLAAEREAAARQVAARMEAQRQETARQEAARVESVRLAAERQETERRAAAEGEAKRQEVARQEAARVETARLADERQETARQAAAQLEAQRQEVARQEAARIEVARLAADREEAARQAAAQLDAQRQEVARQEAARVEGARLAAERQESARQAAAERQESARQEAAQQAAQRQQVAREEAARVEAARLAAERQEAARQAAAQGEAQRQEVARQEAARVAPVRPEPARQASTSQESARVEVAPDDAAKRREAVLRAIGRQLDEEAARRDAAATASPLPNTLPYSLSTARRARLWGRTDPNAELVEYAEAWARKIQFNTVVDRVRDVVKRPHTPSMVTVAVRSDGSVESVTFVISSGVAEVDEAIRRIVESQRPYPAFSRALAREFDVIEIRRTWHFDSAVRLQ